MAKSFFEEFSDVSQIETGAVNVAGFSIMQMKKGIICSIHIWTLFQFCHKIMSFSDVQLYNIC